MGPQKKTELTSQKTADNFWEYGKLPDEREEKNPQTFELIDSIKQGKRTLEILYDFPNLALRVRDLEILRQTVLSERYATEIRNVETIYFGGAFADKIKRIYERYNDICRITHFNRSGQGILYDNYAANDILLLQAQDFNLSLMPIQELITLAEGYPLYLRARYTNRVACFTKLFIVSDFSIMEQYKDVQLHFPQDWQRLLNHITKVVEFHPDGTTEEIYLK